MEQLNLETSGSETLIYHLGPKDQLDEAALEELTSGSLTGVLTAAQEQPEAGAVRFQITGRIPLSQYLSGDVDQRRVLSAFLALSAALRAAEEYEMPIVLEAEHIYLNKQTTKAELLCLPLSESALPEPPAPVAFFRTTLSVCRFDRTENGTYVARIFSYLNGRTPFSFADFSVLLEQLQPSKNTIQLGPTSQLTDNQLEQDAPEAPSKQRWGQSEPRKKKKRKHGFFLFGRKEKSQPQVTTAHPSVPEVYRAATAAEAVTTDLRGAPQQDMRRSRLPLPILPSGYKIPILVRDRTGEQIKITKAVFRIGKERSYVDYFIGDNPAISRSHANVVTRDDKYYLTDTNSLNHTYLNEKRLDSNIEYPLKTGDQIRLADELFSFVSPT